MKRLRTLAVVGVLAGSLAVAPTAGSQPENKQATFGNLIAALNNINVQIDRLNVLSNLNADQIRIVNVENVLSGNRVNALNNALNRNDVDIDALQNFLNNNECSVVAVCDSLNNLLQNADIAITDVIAVNVLSGGDVVVFANG